jgi:molybdate transport system permease protein
LSPLPDPMMHDAWVPLALSLKVAGWATALDIVLGVAAGLALARWRSGARDVVDSLLTLPLVMPPTVLGYYLLVLLGKRGVVGAWLDTLGIRLVFSWQGAVIAAMVVAFPLVLKSARAAFEAVDPQYEQAARTLGISEAAVFFRVTLPLAARGILAGALLAFARALGEFGATLMIAGNLPGRTQTLSVAVYAAVQAGDDNTAAVLVLFTSVVCVVVLVVAGRLVPQHSLLTSR